MANNSEIINFKTEDGLKMFDALSRTNSARQIKPLDQNNYITYDHRYYYDDYNLRIGDVFIMIPPEFIHVTSESYSQTVNTLRQENPQKQKTGYHKRTINMSIIFDGMDEINGYKVPGPTHKDNDKYSNFYYVDGLRTLLAEFKLTPFLPIKNDLLNNSYKIYVVALQSIVIETIEGFQNAFRATIILQEVDMMPYIEMPNMMFQHTIDWDLFRYYIQSLLTEEHVYKKLQSLPVNKDHTAFKLSILKESVLQSITYDSNGDASAKTIGDQITNNGLTKEQSILQRIIDPDSYDIIIDSEQHDVHITNFYSGYSNMLTSIQMADSSSPTLQYLGGLDTTFQIIFETTEIDVVGSIEQCQIQNDLMIRNNPKIRGSIGFVKIESDLVTFCGSLFCTIESVETCTVQGIPGLYQVRLSCVSYDITQSQREELNGFMPFNGYESSISELNTDKDSMPDGVKQNAYQAIDQSYEGLMKKIYQDNYAEWKLRTSMEVYPDLRLPTYAEVNEAITNINAFRKANNKDQLPYKEYPIQPNNILFGEGEQLSKYPNHWCDNGGANVYKNGTVPDTTRNYNVFVDPDFYVFYPNTYLSLYKEEEENNKDIEQSSGESSGLIYSDPAITGSKSGSINQIYNPIYDEGEDTDSKITKFITILKCLIGKHYCPLAEGEVEDYLGPMFDEIGLITYALKMQGILPDNFKRLSYSQFGSLDIFREVSIKDIKRGDIIVNSDMNNCSVCTGMDATGATSIIICTESKGVSEEQLFYDPGHVYRILPLQPDNNTQGTSQSNPYDSDGNQFPDENGEIKQKAPTYLETTDGYESGNPYGDDENKNLINQTSTTTSTNAYSNVGSNGNSATTSTVDQDLGIWSPISTKELNDYINKKAPKNSPFRGNADVFIRAAKESGLDPRYLLAHAALESGWGTSRIARNKNNYFGIGAFDSSAYKSAYSFSSGLAAGIIEGAKWIANNYYNGKYDQKTLNRMRNNNGVHQYATDPEWANKIASIMDGMPKNYSARNLGNNSNNSSNNTVNSYSSTTTTTTNISNQDQIKLKEYDRRNRANTANELQEETKPIQLNQADISGLSLPEIRDDGSNWTDGSVSITEYKTMTLDEFNSLALAVAVECEGENIASKMAMAQYLYDLSQTEYKGSGLTVLLKAKGFKGDRTSVEQQDKQEAMVCVQRVFQAGMRWKKNCTVLAFTSFANSNQAVEIRNCVYTKLGSAGEHNFYGNNQYPSATIGYNIEGYGVSQSSSNSVTVVRQYEVISYNVDSISGFGKPIYIKASHFDTHDSIIGEEWQELNNDTNRIFTSFVDDCQYSAKGRLVKAFPAFLFCILDDQSQWFDGRKLWTNYYTYKPVVDIQYHAANDMPTETAQIIVTNTYHNLDRSSARLVNYSIKDDKSYSAVNRWLYGHFNMIIGGLKITDRMIQLHSILYKHTKIKEGARCHLRMGYGSDPLSLAPVINGSISSLSLGDQITILITSDGHELIQNITTEKAKDLNNGALGTGLGATQEASNIISQILVKRQSWMNHLFFGKKWFEGSKYNIEHFGLYINSGDSTMYNGLAGGINALTYEQYDLLMNIYTASTKEGWLGNLRHWNYMYHSKIFTYDGEANIVFNKYNMTPWDVFQLCAQTTPEFITKPEMYQFDSRLYFGLPFELTKFRYDIINGTIYQECKANTQMHYIDSVSAIIENQVSVTSRNNSTNAKVIYTRGSTPKATSVIHSDDTIDNSKQSTKIIDSCITQNYLGWDAAAEVLHIARHGKMSARKLGISNLLYGWEQQYQGQLLCLGQPHIKPHDYLMVNDFYANLNGLCTVREVIHSFSSNTGFTSSIIPGVIGFCPEQDSGNIELMISFLKLYSSFTEYSQSRKIIIDQADRYAVELAQLDTCVANIEKANKMLAMLKVGNIASGIGKDVAIGIVIYKVIRGIKNVGNIIKYLALVKDSLEVMNAGIKLFNTTRNVVGALRIINTISKGTKAASLLSDALVVESAGIAGAGTVAGVVAGGWVFAICVIIAIAIDILLDSLFEWIENRNTVVLLPLWWEAEPFIAGIKDGEKILLIPAQGSATEENNGQDGVETDEDEITVDNN